MEYLKEKYTKEYFLSHDAEGNEKPFGVVGLEEYLSGGIREQDRRVLAKINFEGKSVLDLGFGRGEAIKYAHDHGANYIEGVDFSQDIFDLTTHYLKNYGVPAKLYCSDISKFLKKSSGKQFDIILLLDVVEHIPREEFGRILSQLQKHLSSHSILVINTPVFKVDNDGFKDDIDPRSFEESDEHEETKGMHINRYTQSSLLRFMQELGYTCLSSHYFVKKINFPKFLENSVLAKLYAYFSGFPFYLGPLLTPESHEYAYPRQQKTSTQISDLEKVYRLTRHLGKKILIRLGLIDVRVVPEKPAVRFVINGPLAGFRLFLGLKGSPYWKQMLLGSYDHYIYTWTKKHLNLKDKVVWDIGAHFGYHTLCFASLVGEKGGVVAFEPNSENVKRLKKNLKLNPSLAGRVKVIEVALSNKDGQEELISIDEIEDSRSMGSHLSTVLPPVAQSVYQGFSSKRIKIKKIDSLLSDDKLPLPDIIKIDVEGAESLVIDGGLKLLIKHKPTLFIEVHNILQMFEVQKTLLGLGYDLEIIEGAEVSVSRCFVVARQRL